MAKKKRDKIKDSLVVHIRRNGVPIRTKRLARRIAIPESMTLPTLLEELVEEGRLIQKPTLLVNGEMGYIYEAT